MIDIDAPLSDRTHDKLRLAILELRELVSALDWRADADNIRDHTAQDGIDTLQVQMVNVLGRLDALEAGAPEG